MKCSHRFPPGCPTSDGLTGDDDLFSDICYRLRDEFPDLTDSEIERMAQERMEYLANPY